jgi:cobalt/nickel transport system ATP-binding protein
MEQILEVKDLSYSYPDGSIALDKVSLKVAAGEIVAILGPNGAGKSTLLLHLAKILEGRGEIRIKGKDLREKKRNQLIKEIGIVFQNPDDQLFMPTVEDDVAFGPLNLGWPEEKVKEKVAAALQKVGLSGHGERLSMNLSFGEKKRAALATVLSMDPEIIVMDEPTANLDPRSRRALVKVMKQLKSEGKTLILSTHDVSAVPEVADRIYVLNRTMVAEGTPRQIFSDAALLKQMNLEVPAISYLFEILNCFGYDCEDLPLSMDEAVNHLIDRMDSGGGHIHLHLHEHTHEDLKNLREKHEHHI